MPTPNDLTPEEEAMFSEHGVAPAGPGSEPVVENGNDVQDQSQQQSVIEAEQQERQQNEQPRQPNGQFAPRQQEQTQEGQQPQQQTQEGQQGEQQPQMVPHQALHAERQRAAQAIRTAQLATARMNALLAQQQGQGDQEPALPDLNEDPVGYIRGLESRLARFEQERQQETQYRQIDTAIEQDEQLFAQTVPDYEQASDYYVQSRAAELLNFYTPQDAQRILMQEARSIANQAWQRGQSVGQTVYTLAQARGYRTGQPAPQPFGQNLPQFQSRAEYEGQQQGQGQNTGQRRGPTAQAVVESVNRGQQASRSLSGGTGASTQTLNADALLNMSDEEFEQYLQLGKKGANARFAALG